MKMTKNTAQFVGNLVKKIFTMIILNQMFQLQELFNLISHIDEKSGYGIGILLTKENPQTTME
jgi:hypothetical protein